MRILAIDFETANSHPASACSIGYCLWDEGEVVDSQEILIRPHPLHGTFQYWNIRIHGITPDMVEFSEEWPMVFLQIKDLFKDSIVVAHNAPFDIGVLRALNQLYRIDMDDFVYLDTVTISRLINPGLVNHRLNTVCEYLNVDLNHHHAQSDSFGCMAIMEEAMEQFGEYDVETLMEKMYMPGRHYRVK